MKKVLISLALGTMISISAFAQDKPADAVQIPEQAAMMQVAGQLLKYGYANGEALPLIQAVEIYQSLGGKAFSGEKEGDAASADGKESKVSFDIPQILADATELAEGNANLIGLIDGLKNVTTRGATSNYAVTTETVRAGGTDSYKVQFWGGEQAIVVVSGDGDTDLDLYIYDPYGNIVARDTDYTDDCVVAWYPPRTQTYTIKIVNRGRVSNVYRMAVN